MNRKFNLQEAIINHIDLGDLMLDILKERDEQRDNPHAFGCAVLCLLNDFADKVQAEHDAKVDLLTQTHFFDSHEALENFGCFRYHERKEA